MGRKKSVYLSQTHRGCKRKAQAKKISKVLDNSQTLLNEQHGATNDFFGEMFDLLYKWMLVGQETQITYRLF